MAYRNNSHWIIPAAAAAATSCAAAAADSDGTQQQQQQQQDFVSFDDETGDFFERQVPNRLLDVAGPSNHVAYFDAASLYPSSGTHAKQSHARTHYRGQGLAINYPGLF